MCLLVIVSYFHKNGLQATNSNAKFYLITHPAKFTHAFNFMMISQQIQGTFACDDKI